MPVTWDDDPQPEQAGDQRPADQRDPPDVAGDVGVLLARREPRSSHRGRARPLGLDRPSAALARSALGLGGPLLGDDLRLELGGAGLLGSGVSVWTAG